MVITSTSNEQIKKLIQLKEKSKVRKTTGTFTVEGKKMFVEIPAEDLVSVYVSETFLKENGELVKEKKYQIVSDQVFKKISDTVTPQGIVAVVKQKSYSIDYIIEKRNKEKSCIVVLDRLQDPGNMGTIVRTGEAAGISGIIMSKDSADIYNPKVIRSTMGSIFRVPFAIVDDLTAAVDTLKDNGITTYAAHLKGELYNSGSLTKDCALLIGNEARGLSEEISAKADKLIKIPMHGKVESLNAAVAIVSTLAGISMDWRPLSANAWPPIDINVLGKMTFFRFFNFWNVPAGSAVRLVPDISRLIKLGISCILTMSTSLISPVIFSRTIDDASRSFSASTDAKVPFVGTWTVV